MEKINLGQYEFLGERFWQTQKNKRHWKGQKKEEDVGSLKLISDTPQCEVHLAIVASAMCSW
jgi:hypothetical protein